MATPVTITVDQEARTLSLSRNLDVGGNYLATINLSAAKLPLFASGTVYAITLKPAGRPSDSPYGTWPLVYVSATSATVAMDLALDALYAAIEDRDYLPCILGIDEVGGGPLAYTTEQRLVRIGNQARRPDDVAAPAVGTPISREEVTELVAGLEGLALSDEDPEALAAEADPGDDTAAARGNHQHARDTAASEAEAGAGTETAIRSWSPLRVWQGVAGYLASLLTTAGTVLYRGGSGLAALTLRTTIRAAGVADDTSLPTEAAVRAQIDGRLALSLLTTAGGTIRATGSGAAEEVPALTALPEAGAGGWSPTLKANSTHTVTRSGIWTGITPSGLESGEGCMVRITGEYATTTTGILPAYSGALDDIAAAVVDLVIYRIGSTYYGACAEVP